MRAAGHDVQQPGLAAPARRLVAALLSSSASAAGSAARLPVGRAGEADLDRAADLTRAEGRLRRRGGPAGHGRRQDCCWPPQPRVTSDRTPWLISARWTSRFIPPRTALDTAAAEIDADPQDRNDGGKLRALRLRALVEAVSTEVMQRVGRALGAGPLCRRRGSFAPGGGPDRVSAPASRRAQPGRARRARGPQRCLVVSGLWPNRYIRTDTTPVSVAQATGLA